MQSMVEYVGGVLLAIVLAGLYLTGCGHDPDFYHLYDYRNHQILPSEKIIIQRKWCGKWEDMDINLPAADAYRLIKRSDNASQ